MRCALHALTRSSLGALSAIAVAAAPISVAGAQQAGRAWRVQPTAGLWVQEDRGVSTANRLGQFAGLEVSRQHGARTRLTASTGYYRIGDALEVMTTGQGQPRTEVYDVELVPVSAGIAHDVWQSAGTGHAVAISLGLEAGAAWSRDHFVRSTGPDPIGGPPGPGEFSPAFLAAPALAVRRAVARQLEATVGVRTLLAFGDLTPGVLPTFSAGLAWRL